MKDILFHPLNLDMSDIILVPVESLYDVLTVTPRVITKEFYDFFL